MPEIRDIFVKKIACARVIWRYQTYRPVFAHFELRTAGNSQAGGTTRIGVPAYRGQAQAVKILGHNPQVAPQLGRVAVEYLLADKGTTRTPSWARPAHMMQPVMPPRSHREEPRDDDRCRYKVVDLVRNNSLQFKPWRSVTG